jgi:dihydrofolate reductase
MRKLSVFNFITLNGFYKGPADDISWHVHGDEEAEYSKDSIGRGNVLLFGRVTYEMMAAYWPSKVAKERDPIVAAGMDKAEKIVFSRTLQHADWHNTRIISNNIAEEVQKLKQQPGRDMTILGSGSIAAQLAERDLIDEYQFMVDPVLLGNGTTTCAGLSHKLDLRLTAIRHFKSGTVLLVYIPMDRSDDD